MQYKLKIFAFVFCLAILCRSCSSPNVSNAIAIEQGAAIYPDYTGITVPPNIAPLNFRVDSEGDQFWIKFVGKNGRSVSISTDKNVVIPIRKWRKLLKENIGKSYEIHIYRKFNHQWEKFPVITNQISTNFIDPYLTYRLVPPSFDGYASLVIQQRNLESFKVSDLINNSLTDGSCFNCHITNSGNPNEFVVHFRAQNPGTVIYKDGEFRRLNTRTSELGHPAVYPAWHPSGRFIAFATLMPNLTFNTCAARRSLVYDINANIALLDLSTNTMLSSPKLKVDGEQKTFPTWSPDGKFLYFCRSLKPCGFDTVSGVEKYLALQFDLMRISFDEHTLSFGEVELIIDASSLGRSVASPKVSPDGKSLIFGMTEHGTNSVWRQDSDLYRLDLQTLEWEVLDMVNSSDSESYFSWSSNSRWIVFGSKRRDGLISLPYFSHIDANGHASKPFLLPQRNPNFYETFIRSFNVPELVKGRTGVGIFNYQRAAKGTLISVDFDWTNDK